MFVRFVNVLSGDLIGEYFLAFGYSPECLLLELLGKVFEIANLFIGFQLEVLEAVENFVDLLVCVGLALVFGLFEAVSEGLGRHQVAHLALEVGEFGISVVLALVQHIDGLVVQVQLVAELADRVSVLVLAGRRVLLEGDGCQQRRVAQRDGVTQMQIGFCGLI